MTGKVFDLLLDYARIVRNQLAASLQDPDSSPEMEQARSRLIKELKAALWPLIQYLNVRQVDDDLRILEKHGRGEGKSEQLEADLALFDDGLKKAEWQFQCSGERILERWTNDEFLEDSAPVPDHDPDRWPWAKYEDYMHAQLIRTVQNEQGRLHVRFPANAREDKDMHVHPISDRVITVIEGFGSFRAIRKFEEIELDIERGNRIWMPRGVVHNFLAGPSGLLVESLRLPFVPFENPLCFVRVNVD